MTIRRILLLGGMIIFLTMRSTQAVESQRPSLANLAIPESLGNVDERFEGSEGRWVVYIQDVHAHIPAQENIAAIVDHLNAVYGVETVALEGGWLETSLPISRELPTSREKQMVARAILENAYLTGPGYAALFSQTPIHLIGMEDAELYEQNRAVYLHHLAERNEIVGKIQTAEARLEETKDAVFNPALRRLDIALQEFREDGNVEAFLPAFFSLIQPVAVDLSDLDQLTLYREILKTSESITKEKLQSEAGRLMNAFKDSRLNFEELLRSGQISDEKLTFYPETRKYITLIDLEDRLDHERFFNQVEEAIGRLKKTLFQSEEERLLDAKSERFRLAKKVILLGATPSVLKKYREQKTLIQAEWAPEGLLGTLELAEQFYALAEARDKIFFEKITTDPRLRGNIAVVAGGFHTEGLSQRLKKAGISYTVLTPDLAKTKPDEALYFKRLLRNPGRETLSYYLEYLEPVFDKELFPRAVSVLVETRNLVEARNIFELPVRAAQEAVREEGHVFTMKDFLALTEEEQQKEVVRWADQMDGGSIPIAIMGMQQDMIQKSPLSRALFRRAKDNPANTFFLVIPEEETIHEESIGGRARMVRIRAVNLPEARQKPQAARRLEDYVQKRLAAAISPDYRSRELLVLPPEDFILLLVRPLLEGQLKISPEAAVRARFFERLREIVMTLELLKQVRAAA